MGGRRGAHRGEDREQRGGVHNTQDRGRCRQSASIKRTERSAVSGAAVGGRGRTRRTDAYGRREGRESERSARARRVSGDGWAKKHVEQVERRRAGRRRGRRANRKGRGEGGLARRKQGRGRSRGEGRQGAGSSKERSTQDARRAATETRRETNVKNPIYRCLPKFGSPDRIFKFTFPKSAHPYVGNVKWNLLRRP